MCVIIPTFNRWALLSSAVTSVLGQYYRHVEVFVVDDGSSEPLGDPSWERDARVRLMRMPHTGLPAVARNWGIREASGALVAFLDDDNEWLPEKLELQLAVLRERPEGAELGGWRYLDYADPLRTTRLFPRLDVLMHRMETLVARSRTIAGARAGKLTG